MNLICLIFVLFLLILVVGVVQVQSVFLIVLFVLVMLLIQLQFLQQLQLVDLVMVVCCIFIVKSMIGVFDCGDMMVVIKLFDLKLYEKLLDDKLKEGWVLLGQKFGQCLGFGQIQSQQINDVIVVLLLMIYQCGKIGVQVVCNDKGVVFVLQIGQIVLLNMFISLGMMLKVLFGG